MKRALLAAGLLVGGCSNGNVTFSVDTPSSQSGQALTQAGSGTASAPLVLTRVRLLINEAEFHGADKDMKGGCPNMGHDGRDGHGPGAARGPEMGPPAGHEGMGHGGESKHVEQGPFVVELSATDLSKGATRQFHLTDVPHGSYQEASLELEPLEKDDRDSSDPALADFKAEHASVLIDGTYQGKPFRFAGHFEADQSFYDLKVSDAPVDLALKVDPSGWFRDAQGALLDPTNPALHDQLAASLCASLDLKGRDLARQADGTGLHAKPRCQEHLPSK